VTVNLPASVSFAYDPNGNLTNDGLRTLEYDFENQLTNVLVPGHWRSEFRYDAFGRRRVRREYTWAAGDWHCTNEVRYVCDGLLALQERHFNPQLSPTTPQQVITYTRGRDLSGNLQAAGGIGGLLARTEAVGLQSPTASYYHADGNGNITCLVSTNAAVVAQYAHDPYGNLLALSGPIAEANLYRFSSREYHPNAGLCYYGYRYYAPSLQRWVNQDPLADIESLANQITVAEPWNKPDDADEMSEGDFQSAWLAVNRNLYGAIGNDPVNSLDFLGLQMGCATLAAEPTLLMSEEALEAYKLAQAARAARAAIVAAGASLGSGGDRAETRQYGKGERHRQHESDKPYKGFRIDPKDPTKIRGKDQNGKEIVKNRPKDFPVPQSECKGEAK